LIGQRAASTVSPAVQAPAPRRAGRRTGWRHLASAHPDLVAAALLAVAALLFYYPLVFLGRAVVDYDAFVYFYPQRAFLGQALRHGQLPLWNPYLFMGAPFLANPQAAVLYPFSWLFAIGPVWVGYSAQLVLHSFLAAWFMYLFARHALGCLPLAAATGGLAYGFSGFAVGQAGHLNQLSAAAWLPVILLAYERAVYTRRPIWVATGAVALGLQILAGHPQVVYMTLITLVLLGVVCAPWRAPVRLGWAVLAGVLLGGVGVLLAAAQLLPTLELAPLSIRGGGVQWRDAVAGSLPPYLFPRALLPPYWLDGGSTEFWGYIGMVPVTLGILALLFARSRYVAFGAVLILIGVLLALGENVGWYRWFFDNVPQFSTFRVPARWLFLWQVGGCVLVALGADWIGRGAVVDRRGRDLWPRVVAVGLLLGLALAWQRVDGEAIPFRRTPAVWFGLAAVTFAAGAAATLHRTRLAQVVLVGLVAVELFAAGSASTTRLAPPAQVDDPGLATGWLLAHGDPAARSLSAARADYVSDYENEVRARLPDLSEEVIESLLVARKWRDTLAPNVPLQYQLRTADGYDGGVLPLQRFVELSSLLVPSPRPDGVLQSRLDTLPDARLLDLIGARYVVVNDGYDAPSGATEAALGDLDVYDRQPAATLDRIVYHAGPPLGDDDALTRLGQTTFDPNDELVLAAPASVFSATGSQRPGEPVAPSTSDAEHWRAHVSLAEPGYLLQREAWYPGWRARVDGQDAPVERADLLFRAVPIPAGEHDVEVYFDSRSFRRGMLVSMVGVLAVLVLCFVPWQRLGHRPGAG
jgi:hypothetical protein